MLSSSPPSFAIRLAQAWLVDDPTTALANFTWVNNVTVGTGYCTFVYAGADHCLARHDSLPFTGISVQGDDPALLRQLAAELLLPGQQAYTLAPNSIAGKLTQAVTVLEVRSEWQMLFRGDSGQLDAGSARLLEPDDLPAMTALAALDEVMVFGPDTFARGAFFGVFAAGELVAMGGVQTELPGLAEIGSIITHPEHRRRGYATQVVSTLIQYLEERGQTPFLCLFQTNKTAFLLYEYLGFVAINELQLVRWQLPFTVNQ